jgi:8-oxo-dGTP pyrophosphatase MutT (NUDIX family)
VVTEHGVRAALDEFARTAADRPDLRASAVAIVLVTTADGGVHFLLTRRAPKLRAHAGQWALPGGRLDPGENAVAAARRELHEEIGLELGEDSVLGMLDDYPTRSGYVITPVVLWAGPVSATGRPGTRPLRPARSEVAALYGVPLDQLDIDPIFLSIPESDQPVIRVPLLRRYVHAPTGAVLYQFREVVLRGRHTRVAHLEQPVFAWR